MAWSLGGLFERDQMTTDKSSTHAPAAGISAPVKRPRPEPGTTTVTEIRLRICLGCGCVIDGVGCSYGCPYDDCDEIGPHFIAVYEHTEKFLRDEPAVAPEVADEG